MGRSANIVDSSLLGVAREVWRVCAVCRKNSVKKPDGEFGEFGGVAFDHGTDGKNVGKLGGMNSI